MPTTLDGAVDLARDRELVERCQAGDEHAFAELYDRYHRRLLRFCMRRLHSYDDAEEAVQESFTRAWRALPAFGGERRFYPWLTVIAANVCTDALRRHARVVPMDEVPNQTVALDADDVDAELLRQVDLAMATEAFTHLSDRHQRVLRLREATEWSAQRIAELEGVAVPAVDTLLWRARQAFKREFAVLADAGGMAGVLGIAAAAFRRAVARAWMRLASHMPAPMRGPGAIAATVALTGAAIAGGGVALVGSGPARSSHGTEVPAAHVATGSTGTVSGLHGVGHGVGSSPGAGATGAARTGGTTSGPEPAGAPAGVGSLAGAAPGTGALPGGGALGDVLHQLGGLRIAVGSAPSGGTVTTASGSLGGAVGGRLGGLGGVAGSTGSIGTGTVGTGTGSGSATTTSGTVTGATSTSGTGSGTASSGSAGVSGTLTTLAAG